MWHLLNVTLFSGPNSVTISGKHCSDKIRYLRKQGSGNEVSVEPPLREATWADDRHPRSLDYVQHTPTLEARCQHLCELGIQRVKTTKRVTKRPYNKGHPFQQERRRVGAAGHGPAKSTFSLPTWEQGARFNAFTVKYPTWKDSNVGFGVRTNVAWVSRGIQAIFWPNYCGLCCLFQKDPFNLQMVTLFTTRPIKILNLCQGQEMAPAWAKEERVCQIPSTVGPPLQQPVLAESWSCQHNFLPLWGVLGPPGKQQGPIV